jgi:hypothetical protein
VVRGRRRRLHTVAKSAVVALARSIAIEVLDAGVRVNAVLPSTIDTAATRGAMPDANASRWVQPESLAAVIDFLLSDAARDVSGAGLLLGGAATAFTAIPNRSGGQPDATHTIPVPSPSSPVRFHCAITGPPLHPKLPHPAHKP